MKRIIALMMFGWCSACLGVNLMPDPGEVCIEQKDQKGDAGRWFEKIKVPAGIKTLYCSVWVKTQDVTGDNGSLHLWLFAYDKSGKEIGKTAWDKIKDTPAVWRKVRSAVAIPENTETVRVGFQLYKASGRAWLKKMVLETEDFGTVTMYPNGNRRIFDAGETIEFGLESTRAGTVQIVDYNDTIVRNIHLEKNKRTPVKIEKAESGIYWITDGGVYIDEFAVVNPVKPLANPEDAKFGVHHAYIDRAPGYYTPKFDIYRKIGAIWLRCSTMCPKLEDDQQKRLWPARDRFIEEAAGRGLITYSFFEPMNFPYNTGQWKNPNVLGLMERYVAQHPNLKYFEVWNEPNGKDVSIDDYFQLHKKFYEKAKKANPKAVVVHGSMAGAGFSGQWGCELANIWQDKLLAMGIDKYTDVYNLHFYPYQWDTREFVEKHMMTVYRKYGVKKPIWVTENGMAAEMNNMVQQREQAEYLVRSAVTCLALGVEKYFWFLAFEHPEFHYGLIDEDLRPKAALVAYGAMAGLLNETIFDQPVKTNSKLLEGYRFKKGNKEVVVVLWSKKGTLPVELGQLNLPEGKWTKIDLMGRKTPLSKDTSLSLTAAPFFILIEKSSE
jgi:hypothetical protein